MPIYDPNLAHSGLDRLQNIEQYLEGPLANTYGPADHGFLAWTFDPYLAQVATAPAAGFAYFQTIRVPSTIQVSTLWFMCASAASTVTSGQNFVGLYQPSGTTATQLVSVGADSLFTSTGAVSASFTQLTLSPGLYYTCHMQNATTPGKLLASGAQTIPPAANMSKINYRAFSNTSGNTTSIPNSITISSNGANAPFWSALS